MFRLYPGSGKRLTQQKDLLQPCSGISKAILAESTMEFIYEKIPIQKSATFTSKMAKSVERTTLYLFAQAGFLCNTLDLLTSAPLHPLSCISGNPAA